jgi:hypothetical protein
MDAPPEGCPFLRCIFGTISGIEYLTLPLDLLSFEYGTASSAWAGGGVRFRGIGRSAATPKDRSHQGVGSAAE